MIIANITSIDVANARPARVIRNGISWIKSLPKNDFATLSKMVKANTISEALAKLNLRLHSFLCSELPPGLAPTDFTFKVEFLTIDGTDVRSREHEFAVTDPAQGPVVKDWKQAGSVLYVLDKTQSRNEYEVRVHLAGGLHCDEACAELAAALLPLVSTLKL